MSATRGKAKSSRGPEAGLRGKEGGQPIPLRGVRVRGRIAGMLSRVTVEQVYRNEEKVPVEAVYIFPVPESAAVDRVVLRVGERRIEAKVMEREKAFETYDDALADGHGAVLVDQERPNIFTASLGNLLPGQEATVEISYAAEVTWEGGALRFLLPTTVAPRYAPEEDRMGVSPTRAESVSPPVALSVPYGLDLRVDVELPSPLKSAESPSHPVRVEVEGRRATVSLSKEEVALDRDFLLLLTPAEARFPWVRVERTGDGRTCAAVAMVPELKQGPKSGVEVVFLVDRSGSMEGSSIEQVRRALQLSLRSLREGDRFDIVGFGSTYQALFGASHPYSQEALDAASRYVEALDADLGGTELLPALDSVLKRRRNTGSLRHVVLLTDGEVTNEEAVLALASKHARDTRIFAFGIGYGPSEFLVRGLARATGGAAEFIHPGERIEPKVLRQFARVAQPAVTETKLVWEGGSVRMQAPSEPSALFDGEPFVAYALWEGKGPGKVTLSGLADGETLSWSAEVPAEEPAGESLAAPLAARALIREMEEGRGKRGSARSERTQGRWDKEILDLALAHNLVSSCTSMVAVEEREVAGERKPAELRRVPVALTYGWGGSGRRAVGVCAMASPAMVSQSSWALGEMPAFCRGKKAHSDIDTDSVRFRRVGDSVDAAIPLQTGKPLKMAKKGVLSRLLGSRPQAGGAALSPMDALVALQRADGSWPLTEELARALGVDLKALKTVADEFGGASAGPAVATAAALAWLEQNASDREVEWRLLAKKAEAWLGSALGKLPGAPGREALLKRLTALLGAGG